MIHPLRWRSGKFIYPRHAAVLMHFMPLQDFSLEIAQNHSLIIALRMARLEGRTELLGSHEISAWRHTLMSRLTAEIIAGSTPPGGRVIDIGSFSGVHFEELKLCWKHPSTASEYEVQIDTPKARQVFEGLHPRAEWGYQLRAHGTMATAHPGDTLFVNHAAAIRGADMDVPDLRMMLGCDAGRIICALRVSDEAVGRYRTTVYGREVFVPSQGEVAAMLRQSGRTWWCHWLRTHDSGFFLPEDDAGTVGVLIAYHSDGYRAAGFHPVQ